jgi:hypothetical protein
MNMRDQKSVKESNKLFKKGMATNVKNMPKKPSRGGYRL